MTVKRTLFVVLAFLIINMGMDVLADETETPPKPNALRVWLTKAGTFRVIDSYGAYSKDPMGYHTDVDRDTKLTYTEHILTPAGNWILGYGVPKNKNFGHAVKFVDVKVGEDRYHTYLITSNKVYQYYRYGEVDGFEEEFLLFEKGAFITNQTLYFQKYFVVSRSDEAGTHFSGLLTFDKELKRWKIIRYKGSTVGNYESSYRNHMGQLLLYFNNGTDPFQVVKFSLGLEKFEK